MYFLKFNNKITRATSLVTFCFLHWNSHLCLTNGLLLTSKTLLYMLRTELYRKASKDFQAADFHCYISNNTYFPLLLKSFKEIPPPPPPKKKVLSKSGDIQQTKWYMQKVPFYEEDYVYQASEL